MVMLDSAEARSEDYSLRLARESIREGGLDWDVINEWSGVFNAILSGDFETYLTSLHRYADRVKATSRPELADIVLSQSDPEVVVSYDALVNELNEALPQLRSSKDVAHLQDLYNRVVQLKDAHIQRL